MNDSPAATRRPRARTSASTPWVLASALALALALAGACRPRSFNAGAAGSGAAEDAGPADSGATWIACRAGAAWVFAFDAASQTLTIAADGKGVFQGEVRSHVDRALPVARVHGAYGLRDAASYARQEITTDHGNVTIDRVIDDGEPLERVLLLAFRIEGDGVQRTLACDTTAKVDFSGTKPAGLEKGRYSALGPDAYARAPRWSPLTKPSRTVVEGHEEVAACETASAGAATTRWLAMTKEDRLVVGRVSGLTTASSLDGLLAPIVARGRIAKRIEQDADRDVEGARYFVSTVTWKLERGDDVRIESFTERKAGGGGLFRGTVWTLGGRTLRCPGQLGLLPPGA